MFDSKKYLDELEQIKRNKGELEAEESKKVKDLELHLAGLEKASQDALADENSTEYVKLGGEIAVCKAKLEASRGKANEVYPNYVEDIKAVLEKANSDYIKATNSQAEKLEKAFLDLQKGVTDLGKIIDEYSKVYECHGLTKEELGSVYQIDDLGSWNGLERLVRRESDGTHTILSKIKEFYTE